MEALKLDIVNIWQCVKKFKNELDLLLSLLAYKVKNM